ncbi:hypothetical protein TRFO_30957 [Tritrichomonas foetus]|uniref:RRM domain-containing protein n=1 Tax=Tritrichomonas foetus TaxID=1144522 RepID=A0A1J4JSF8_9EUKA|nr:hypothetical protein TRFO_30957 [Tritrichomonas foetus]|eukprot:OHT02041.1 hypothetical protein TRFO_30957 [Tritrichomonas foetus]
MSRFVISGNNRSLNYFLVTEVERITTQDLEDRLISVFKKIEFFSSAKIKNNVFVLIGFRKKVDLNDIKSFLISCSVKYNEIHQYFSEDFPKPSIKNYWLYNLPKDKENPHEDLCHDLIDPAVIQLLKYPNKIVYLPNEENVYLVSMKVSMLEMQFRIEKILPYFLPNICTDDRELPIILIREEEITKEIFEEAFVDVIKTDYDIDILHIWSNNNNDTVFFSVNDNEQAWTIINSLNFGMYGDKSIQFSHFLSYSTQEEIKKWNLYVKDIPEEDATLLNVFTLFKSNEKKIISIAEDPKHKNCFYIQFLYEEDAKNVISEKDFDVSFIGRSIMNVYNFEGDESDLRTYFGDDIEIYKIEMKKGCRPFHSIRFNSQDELDEALEIGNTIVCNGIQLMCLEDDSSVNKKDAVNQASFKLQERNGVFIPGLGGVVTFNEAVDILSKFGELSNLQIIGKNVIAAFTHVNGFRRAFNQTISLKGKNFHVNKYRK